MTQRIRRGCCYAALLCAAIGATSRVNAVEPNETWDAATVLEPGVLSITDRIDALLATDNPDVTLGAFDPQQNIIAVDDDGSPEGNGLASALFDLPVNDDGSVRLAVSGYADFDFDGLNDFGGNNPHSQSGAFSIEVSVFDDAGQLVEQFFDIDALVPGAIRSFAYDNPEWIGGTFDAVLDNDDVLGANDVDFWAFTGLPADAPFVAEITGATFDTLLGWFDGEGNLRELDDDSGLGLRSRLQGVVPDEGVAYFAVSAFADEQFVGAHAQQGRYRLEVTIVPEPSTAWIAGLGCMVAGVAGRQRRGAGL